MEKLYAVVLPKEREYEVFDNWDSCNDYLQSKPNTNKQITTFYNNEEGFEKLKSFVNYYFKGTTFEGSRLANSDDAVQMVACARTVNKKDLISYAMESNGVLDSKTVNTAKIFDLNGEQSAILHALLTAVNLYPQGTEILLGVTSDYLVNMHLGFNKASSKTTKIFEQELNRIASGYIIEFAKADNYPNLKLLMKRLKAESKRR